jgi:hypothetical protein
VGEVQDHWNYNPEISHRKNLAWYLPKLQSIPTNLHSAQKQHCTTPTFVPCPEEQQHSKRHHAEDDAKPSALAR